MLSIFFLIGGYFGLLSLLVERLVFFWVFCICMNSFGLVINWMIQGDNWNDLFKEVIIFEFVEEFWGVYVC